jgi:hypothetical protein
LLVVCRTPLATPACCASVVTVCPAAAMRAAVACCAVCDLRVQVVHWSLCGGHLRLGIADPLGGRIPLGLEAGPGGVDLGVDRGQRVLRHRDLGLGAGDLSLRVGLLGLQVCLGRGGQGVQVVYIRLRVGHITLRGSDLGRGLRAGLLQDVRGPAGQVGQEVLRHLGVHGEPVGRLQAGDRRGGAVASSKA